MERTLSACGMAIIGLQHGGDMTIAGFGLILAAAACWGILPFSQH